MDLCAGLGRKGVLNFAGFIIRIAAIDLQNAGKEINKAIMPL